MSAETSVPSESRDFHYWRLRFRAWRGVRPFWAGLLTIFGGVPIMYFPYNDFKMGSLTLTMATTAGAGSLIIGVLLITLGLTMWFHSIVRIFAGVATILLALVSIPVSNIGGFVIGFLLALLGGAMSIAWGPAKAPEPSASTEPAAGQTMALAQVPPQAAGQQGANLTKAAGPGTGTDAGTGTDTNTTGTSGDADGRRNSAG